MVLPISVEVIMLLRTPATIFLQVEDPQALEKLPFNHELLVLSLHHWVLRESIEESISLDSAQAAMGWDELDTNGLFYSNTPEEKDVKKLIPFCSGSGCTHLTRNAGDVLIQQEQYFPLTKKSNFTPHEKCRKKT